MGGYGTTGIEGKEMGRLGWIRVRASAGKIPERVQVTLRQRLERHAATHYIGRCREVLVRFRGRYAYVDAFPEKEDLLSKAAEEIGRIKSTPIHLFRLGYLGDSERWEFAFYKYSTESYQPSFTIACSFEGTPEEAFDTGAVYL